MRVGRDLQRSQKVRVAHVGSSATNISGNNYGSEGWEFESLRLRQLNLNDLRRFLPAFRCAIIYTWTFLGHFSEFELG